jgi:2-polyprenyl-3-methyl-5-hydroxy-6-metoxy-1,4-benzoquinol methylase
MDVPTAAVEEYYNQVAEEYHKIYTSGQLSYKDGLGDYVRLQILLRLLSTSTVRSIYEVGVGDGTPLAFMHRMGYRTAGCDIAPAMVQVARKRFEDLGISQPDIVQADVENSLTLAPQLKDGAFDAVVALGVMPHVHKERLALDNMRMMLRPQGKLYIEFRNSLFSLFTFNRYTHEFITQELLAGVAPDVVAQVSEALQKICKMDMPPRRTSVAGKDGPGYDQILAKFHNPFEIPSLLATSGFGNVKFHWYHFHAAQPWLAEKLGDRFEKESHKMEHRPDDWRGMFLCSAVLVEADAE